MSDLGNLYPFLSGRRQDPARLDAALLHSIDEKARESRETNARFFAEQGQRLLPPRARSPASTAAAVGCSRWATAARAAMRRTWRWSSCIPSPRAARRSPRSTSPPTPRRCPRWATISASSTCSCARSWRRGARRRADRHLHQRQFGEPARGVRKGQGDGHGHHRPVRRRRRQDAELRRGRSLPGGADTVDPSHPGVPRRRLSHPVGPGAHAAGAIAARIERR